MICCHSYFIPPIASMRLCIENSVLRKGASCSQPWVLKLCPTKHATESLGDLSPLFQSWKPLLYFHQVIFPVSQIPDSDLEKRRVGQRVDPLTGEIYTADVYNPDKPEPKKKEENEEEEEEEEAEEEAEEEVNIKDIFYQFWLESRYILVTTHHLLLF